MSVQPKHYITSEEYLEIERAAPFKSEYYAGEMFAMSGTTTAHNLIAINILAGLRPQVRKQGCDLFFADIRLKVSASNHFSYPDLMIVCGPKFADVQKDTVTNPVVIIEVLSDSTEAYDRGEKFAQYRLIDSLQHYILVSQRLRRVEVFSNQNPGKWSLSDYSKPDDSIEVPINTSSSFSLKLLLAEIYEGVIK